MKLCTTLLAFAAATGTASAALVGTSGKTASGKIFELWNDKGTWEAAQDKAQAMTKEMTCGDGGKWIVGGTLAEPESDAENTAMADLIPFHPTNASPDPWYPWIGVIDKESEGTFYLATDISKTAISYSSWAPGEPNDSGSEDCAQMSWRDDAHNTWNDWLCTKNGHGFLVEFHCDKKTTYIGGDPHVKTWSGEMYDFHGACDLVLIQNPSYGSGIGMDIHVRTKFTGQWSYISSAVLRIGEDTLEVMGGSDNKYWINGVANADLAEGITGHAIAFKQVNTKSREFRVELGNNGEAITMKTWKNFVRVDMVNPTEETFGDSLGLLGSYGKGFKIARDKLTVVDDSNAFGMEWQVLPEEPKLFHNLEGVQAPEKCAMPDATKARRRLGESTISQDDAKLACSRVTAGVDRDACVFDVLATNDKDMAGAY